MSKEKWNRKYTERDLTEPGKPSPILVSTVSGLTPGRALDLAAGQGRHAFYLARQGWDTTAVDFSEVAVEKGRMLSRQLVLPVRWEVRDLTDYTPEQAHYDLVCMFYLHMPWEEYSEILLRAAGAVKQGGTLLVVGHDHSNIEQGSGGPQDPEILYSPQKIVAALKQLTVSSPPTGTDGATGPAGNSGAAKPSEPSEPSELAGSADSSKNPFEILKAETQKNPVDHGHRGMGGQQIDCVVVARRLY